MKNNQFTKRWIKIIACLLVLSIMPGQSMVGFAAEDKAQTIEEENDTSQETDVEEKDEEESEASSEVKYITDITALDEEETYLTYEDKLSLEELQSVFPDVFTVTLDGESDTTEIEVTWNCEIDYEKQWSGEGKEIYVFLPKWDESVYEIAEEVSETIEIPTITVEIVREEIPTQIEDLETAQDELQEITEQKSILALVYLCDKYGVKDSPSKGGNTVVTVVSGQSVQIVGVDLDEEGNVWYRISLYQKDKNYTGYIEKQYLATSDEEFLDWTDEYVEETLANKPATMSIMSLSAYPDVSQFPSSYQNSLLALKQKYPNWIFVKMETGLNFNTAVSNELGDKSWISSSKPASWQNGVAAQSGWSLASEGILRYYMDPRNFLTESTIFQFEQLTYNASYHTESAVQAIVANSFMSGDIPGENMTYARAFTKIGEELKVSPFHLASRVLQEQGTKGTSQLISGTYSGFEGYYNYFNVGASGKDVELIVKGLTEAKNRGWNSRYKSLKGGAEVIGKNYILKGQDTLYLQKFNVSSNNTYNHQYMQNILAPSSEAPSIKKAYSDTGSLNNSFVFKIPVYSNMPASACPQPNTLDTITLNKSSISDLAVDKTEKLVPYVNGSKPDNVDDMAFTSNNTSVATVDAQGMIKAISPGTAKITCARNGAASATCTVTVVKAEPAVDTPVLSPVVYKDGLKLADIILPSGWSWSNGNTALEAGTASYPAVYTPEDTIRYLTVTKQVGIKVSQAIPRCTVPENLTAKIGSKLGSIVLPTGFSWESDTEIILDKAGEKTFYLSYDPNDKNYLELNHIPTVVKVIGDGVDTEESDDQIGQLPGGDIGTGGGSGTGGSGSTGSGTGTGSGNSSNGSTGTGDTDNSGSSGTTGSGSTNSSGTTSSDSTGNNGTTSSGSTSTGTTSSDSTNSDTTGSGSTGSNGTTSSGNTSTGTTSSGSTDSDTTSGSTSSGSTGNNGTTGSDSTSNNETTSSGNTSTGSATGNNSTTNSNAVANSNNNSANNNSNINNSGSDQKSGNVTDNNEQKSNVNTGSNNNQNKDGGGAGDNNSIDSNNTTINNSSSNKQNNNFAAGSTNNQNSTNGSSSTAQNGAPNNLTEGTNHSTLLANADSAAEEDKENDEEPAFARASVTMDMEDISILTDEMLQMAKDQNVDLSLKMNSRATWHIYADTVQGNFSDIDMNVLFERNIIPQDLLTDLTGENEYLEFELAHDGPFEFGAELEILLSPEDSGRYANLFYYDSEVSKLEFICACIIDESGYARFDMEHASSYVIIVSDYPMTGIAEEDVASDSESGSALGWIILGVVILAVLAMLGTLGYFYLKKRQKNDAEAGDDTEDEEDEYIEEEDIEDVDEGDLEEFSIDDEKSECDEDEIEIVAKEPVRIRESHVQDANTEREYQNTEDDWIEDEDWQEPEKSEEKDPFADDHAEDDWIEDDEWDISNDWMDDEEWEKKANIKKTAV